MPEFRCYIDSNTDLPEAKVLNTREVVVYSTRSPEKDKGNEDSVAWIVWPDALLLAIADGVGGQPAGGDASMLTIKLLIECFREIDGEQISLDAFRDGVLDTFERANREVQDMGVGSGTTLTVVTVSERDARVFSVGDSSTLICGSKGKVKFVNTPHSPTGYAIAAGVLDENDALHHEERHLLSNLVGSTEMHIDIGPILKLSTQDRILVASDGLWDNMYLEEIVDVVRKGSIYRAANFLQKTCRNRMLDKEKKLPSHADDLSFIVARSVKPAETAGPQTSLADDPSQQDLFF
ncbi:MAG: serine/threonine-protein phosphatase [Arenicellales bacterium]|nr:serine/threonine-protein phosphatase [Arenicellales bacterium]